MVFLRIVENGRCAQILDMSKSQLDFFKWLKQILEKVEDRGFSVHF